MERLICDVFLTIRWISENSKYVDTLIRAREIWARSMMNVQWLCSFVLLREVEEVISTLISIANINQSTYKLSVGTIFLCRALTFRFESLVVSIPGVCIHVSLRDKLWNCLFGFYCFEALYTSSRERSVMEEIVPKTISLNTEHNINKI